MKFRAAPGNKYVFCTFFFVVPIFIYIYIYKYRYIYIYIIFYVYVQDILRHSSPIRPFLKPHTRRNSLLVDFSSTSSVPHTSSAEIGPRPNTHYHPTISCLAPQTWGGGGVRLPTLGLGGTFANKLLNIRFSSILCFKNTQTGECLPVLRATHCWQTYLFYKNMFTPLFWNICTHGFWPPRTSPDSFWTNKFKKPASTNEPDAATLTLHALN